MTMSIIMFFAWQLTGDSKYQAPFNRCAEATYATSELKDYVDRAEQVARSAAPAPAIVLPAAYSLVVRKQMTLVSKKITLVPGTVTSYYIDERARAGAITVTFAF